MRAGLISFGHGMYYCLGGYAVAMTYNFLQIKEVFVLIAFSILAGFIVSFFRFFVEGLEEFFLQCLILYYRSCLVL